jgi:hypothetical protein
VFSAGGGTADLLRSEVIKPNILQHLQFIPSREHSVHCKDQPVNAVKGYNGCLLWESYKTHTHSVVQCIFSVVQACGTSGKYRAFENLPDVGRFPQSNNILCWLLPKQVVRGCFD